MAFPTIPTAGAGRLLSTVATAPSGTHTSPSLSSLTKNSGDLLIAIVIIYDGNSTNAEFSAWGGGFTEFGDFAGTATMGIGCAYKWSTGSETGTFTVTSADASTNDSAFFLMSIPGAHATTPPEAGSFATGTGSSDPASFNPAGWDAEDTLWIAVGGSGETATGGTYTGITAAPTNYTSYADSGISADAIGGVEGAVAFRQLNAASENVGTFTKDTSNARDSALVIAVRPAPPPVHGHAQAQARIKAISRGYAQAQTQIRSKYAHSQSAALIRPIVILDTFTAANGTDLDGHLPDTNQGDAWHEGTAGQINIQSNAITPTGEHRGGHIQTYHSNGILYATFNAFSGSVDTRIQLDFRCADVDEFDNNWRAWVYRSSTGGYCEIGLEKTVAGVNTEVYFDDTQTGFSTGPHEFRVSFIDNEIKLYFDSVLQTTETDSDLNTLTRVGLGFANGGAGTIDNYTLLAAPESVTDTFTRTVANDWGAAEKGGDWTITSGTAADFDIGGATGTIANAQNDKAIQISSALLPSRNVESVITFSFNSGSADIFNLGLGQNMRSGEVPSEITFPQGEVRLDNAALYAGAYAGGSSTTSSVLFSYTPGDTYFLKTRTLATSSQIVQYTKIWKVGTDEPAWQVSHSASLVSGPGHVGINVWSFGSAATPTWTVDNYSAYTAYPVAHGQAQALIQSSKYAHANAQASIKQTYYGFAQVQGAIPFRNAHGQVAALISGDFNSVVDTFTRSLTDDWGTADTGGTYTYFGGNTTYHDVNGSQGILSPTTSGVRAVAGLTRVLTTKKNEFILTWSTDILPTSSMNFKGFTVSNRDYNDDYSMGVFIDSAGAVQATTGVDGSSGGTATGLTYNAGEIWYLKGRVIATSTRATITSKAWKVGDAEPGWQRTTTNTSTVYPGGHVKLEFTWSGSSAVVATVDNYNVYEAYPVAHGQAQAKIQAAVTTYAHAQSQADIKQTYYAHAQAQANIKATGYGHAQAQANIEQTYYQHAQAQANIENTYYGHAQALTETAVGPGPIVIKESLTLNDSNTTSHTITIPSGVVAGDLLLVTGSMDFNTNPTVTWDAALTPLGNPFQPGVDANGVNIAILAAYRIATGGESGTWTVTTTGSERSVWRAYRIINWHGVTPPEIAYFDGSTNNSPDSPNLTVSWTNETTLFISIASVDGVHNVTAYPSGYLYTRTDIHTDGFLISARKTITNSSSENPGASTFDGTTDQWVSATIGIRGLSYYAFAQAQAEIKQTYFAHANAQARIKQTYYGLAQAQADIEATIYQHAQAQANIKNIATNFSNPYAQAQADIKVTSYRHAQAQANIKQTYFAHAQAQANIEQTYYAHSQAQAKINVFNINAFGQARARVGTGRYIWVKDTFTRSESGTWGTPDIGNPYRIFLIDNDTTISINGSEGTIVNDAPNLETIKWAYLTNDNLDIYHAETTVEFKFAQIVPGTDASAYIEIALRNDFEDFNQGIFAWAATLPTPRVGWYIISPYDYDADEAEIEILTDTYYVLKLRVYGDNKIALKFWNRSTPEPEAWTLQGVLPTGLIPEGFTSIVPGGSSYIYIEVQDFSVLGDGAILQDFVDYYEVVEIFTAGFAQAQASIKQTYHRFAQAQADIKQTYYVHAQAQAMITAGYHGLAQAQADIEQTYYVHAQAQARIKNTYFGLAQANADIKNISVAYSNPYAQAQADIKAISRVHAQAQADIKATSYAFAQAQADIKQTYYAHANAQADIKQIYWGLAQAQADIKQIYWGHAQAQAKINAFNVNGYAQAQAWIEQTYHGWAQANADIKNIATAYSNPYAQAQADIRTTYYAHAQAQALIKNTYYGFAQAQANIEQTYYVHSQAQADIKQIYWGFAQAQANIENTYYGLGQAQADIEQTYYVHANAQADIKQTYYAHANAQANIEQTYYVHANAQADIKQIYYVHAQAQADIKQIYYAHAQAQTNIENTYYGHGQAQANTLAQGYAFAQAQADIKQTYYEFAQAQAKINAYNVNAHAQAQALLGVISVVHAQAQAKINAYNVNGFGQAQADILAQGYGFGQAQANIEAFGYGLGQAQTDIKQTYYEFAQAQADIKQTYYAHSQAQANIENTYYGLAQAQANIEQTYYEFGQAQANIKATYYGFAQAQTDIEAVGYGFGQVQANIEQTYYEFGQAQASIKQTYHGLGQAQANILTTYYAHAQANAWIENTYYAHGQAQANILAQGYGFGQAQAKINAYDVNAHANAQALIAGESNVHAQAQAKINAYNVNGFGQAQANIEAEGYGWAQAQANILNTYYGHGQSQADIKQTSYSHGQAQADIKQIYWGHGQAQVNIEQTYNEHGQAQADIKATSYGHGQAQAEIKQTYWGHGQAQANIEFTGYGHGQAQSDIKATSYGHGQANAWIENTYYGHANAQAEIVINVVRYYGHAQAQADIEATGYGHGQAQGDIKQTYNSHAQAQANIENTYYVWAQAQGYIKRTEYGLGQAQADIENTYNVHGQAQASIKQIYVQCAQAQAHIENTYQAHGQANAYIRITQQGYGQAQAYSISGGFGFAQAKAQILQVNDIIIKTILLSDSNAISLTLSSRIPDTLDLNEPQMSLTLSDRQLLSLTLSDRESEFRLLDVEF